MQMYRGSLFDRKRYKSYFLMVFTTSKHCVYPTLFMLVHFALPFVKTAVNCQIVIFFSNNEVFPNAVLLLF